MEYKCPARESSAFLCDKVAEYQINGTVWCNTHARRVLEGDDLTVRVREYTETSSDLERVRQREATERIRKFATSDPEVAKKRKISGWEKSGWEKQVSDINGVQTC